MCMFNIDVTILNTQVFALHNIRGEMKKCCIAPLGTVKKARDCQVCLR